MQCLENRNHGGKHISAEKRRRSDTQIALLPVKRRAIVGKLLLDSLKPPEVFNDAAPSGVELQRNRTPVKQDDAQLLVLLSSLFCSGPAEEL